MRPSGPFLLLRSDLSVLSLEPPALPTKSRSSGIEGNSGAQLLPAYWNDGVRHKHVLFSYGVQPDLACARRLHGRAESRFQGSFSARIRRRSDLAFWI